MTSLRRWRKGTSATGRFDTPSRAWPITGTRCTSDGAMRAYSLHLVHISSPAKCVQECVVGAQIGGLRQVVLQAQAQRGGTGWSAGRHFLDGPLRRDAGHKSSSVTKRRDNPVQAWRAYLHLAEAVVRLVGAACLAVGCQQGGVGVARGAAARLPHHLEGRLRPRQLPRCSVHGQQRVVRHSVGAIAFSLQIPEDLLRLRHQPHLHQNRGEAAAGCTLRAMLTSRQKRQPIRRTQGPLKRPKCQNCQEPKPLRS
jgi:hypothetical protein